MCEHVHEKCLYKLDIRWTSCAVDYSFLAAHQHKDNGDWAKLCVKMDVSVIR